jgi:hypothetical protein
MIILSTVHAMLTIWFEIRHHFAINRIIKNWKLYREDRYARTQKYCTYTDNYLDCLTHTVELLCVSDDASEDDDDKSSSVTGAAEWQRIWNRKLRQRTMYDSYGCPGWEYGYNAQVTICTIILSVILGLTTLIMIIGIIIILLFIKNKKKSRRRAAIPPPPPYTMDPENGTELNYGAGEGNGSSNNASGEAVNMRSMARYPAQPPPYAGKVAPSYEEEEEPAEGATGGTTNPAFIGAASQDNSEAASSAGASASVHSGSSPNKETNSQQKESSKSPSGNGNELYNSWF